MNWMWFPIEDKRADDSLTWMTVGTVSPLQFCPRTRTGFSGMSWMMKTTGAWQAREVLCVRTACTVMFTLELR